MMRIAKLTDYGIVLLTHFARNVEKAYSARTLAEAARLPLPVVSKILKELARHNLLISERGSRGGYRLSRAAQDISVADVIAALDGPIALTECSEGPCTMELLCPAKSNWQKINSAVRDALANLPLSIMTQPLSPKLTIEVRKPQMAGQIE